MTAAQSDDGAWPSATTAWYAVIVLLVAYTFGFIDRSIMTILVEPIEADLHIKDTAIGVLNGFAFVIFYVTLGVPLGWFADRTNRKRLICGSIGLWSLMSASCGLARSFSQLFVARVGVGIGEAGLSPATYSLIADYFPPDRRSAPLGVYQVGIYLGAGLAILAGGLLVAMVGHSPTMQVPVLGPVRSWQAVFMIAGLPGLFVAVLTATIREPLRRSAGLAKGTARAERAQTFAHIRANRSVYILHFIGFACLGTPFNVALLWARPYFSRCFGVSPTEGAYAVGLVMLIFATSGIVIGSLTADRMQGKGRTDATILVGVFAAFALLPFVIAFPFFPTQPTALADLAAVLFFGAFAIGAAPAALQLITPNRMRGVISALYLLVVNMTAQAMGPVVTGFFTDYVFRDPKAVGFSVAIVSTLAALVAAVCLLTLLRPFRRAVGSYDLVGAAESP
jgi:MFS family permease